MRRFVAVMCAVVLASAAMVLPASAGGSDDDSGSGSSEDTPTDDRRDDDDDDDDDDDEDDEDDRGDDRDDEARDDDDDDDDGHRRRRNRNRNRNRNRGGEDGGGSATPAPSGAVAAPGESPASAATVRVNDRSFTPETINVAVGGTLTWANVSRDHTVTADDGSFDSGVFDAGQQFRHTFDSAGSIDYRCLIHPEMTGTVVVGSGSATSAASRAASPSTRSAPSAATARGSSGLPSLGKASVPPPLAAAASGTVDVDVVEYEFAPSKVTVAPGTTVRWTMAGQAPHTVTAAEFDSGIVMPGDTYEQTFSDVGTIEYRCDLHPEMTGTVAVVEGAPAATSGPAGDTDDAGARGDVEAAGASGNPVATSVLADTGTRAAAIALGAVLVLAAGTAALTTSRRRRSAPSPQG